MDRREQETTGWPRQSELRGRSSRVQFRRDSDQPRGGTMTTRDMIHETPLLMAAAMLAHELNRAYCALLGDDSQLPWEDCPQWQQDSALAGVIAIDQNPDQRPEASHEGWLTTKREEGWVYGEKKDPDAKTHPCMVPYTDLSEDQRFKDTLFGAVVRAVLFGVSGASVGDGMDGKVLPDDLTQTLGEMPAEQLAEYGLCRMMGPDPDDPMAPDPAYADIGQPGDAKNPVTASEKPTARELAIEKLLGEHTVKGVMGATFDGANGVMVFYHDGSTARYVHGCGWSAKEPVPDTYAALFAKVDAAMAEAAKAEE